MTDKTTTPEPQKINYRSDFVAVLELADAAGKPIPFPDCDFEAVFWTGNANRKYAISRRGDVLTNCRREPGGGIRAIFDHHGMGVGELKWEPKFRLPDGEFPDGYQDVMRPMSLGVILVTGPGDLPSAAEIAVTLPYIKGDKGDNGAPGATGPQGPQGPAGPKGDKGDKGKAFTYDDFTPEQLEGLRGPQGKSFTFSDLTPGQIAELQRPATEAAQLVSSAIDNVTATNNAVTRDEALRVEAEQARVEAEQARASEFAGFAQAIDKGSLRLFDLQWEQAGGSVIVSGETYGLNGINDLSLSEAMDIYRRSAYVTLSHTDSLSVARAVIGGAPCRTLLPLRVVTPFANLTNLYSNCQAEIIRVTYTRSFWASALNWAFSDCTKLRRIEDDIYCGKILTNAFLRCYALEHLHIGRIQNSLDLSACSKLSLDSISYIVTQANNSATITITLHPDAYARVTDDIFAAAAAKNITIATP